MAAAAAPPADPAPGLNPLFAGVPTFNWHLSRVPGQMAEGHAALWRNDDDNAIRNLFAGEGMGTHIVNHDGQTHHFQLPPQVRGGFFIVNMHGDDGGPPLPLVFNCYNLYFAGFQFENRWYFFNDADLLGSGHDLPGNEGYWRFLPFGGGYKGGKNFRVKIGIEEMIEATYKTLINFRNNFGDKSIVDLVLFSLL